MTAKISIPLLLVFILVATGRAEEKKLKEDIPRAVISDVKTPPGGGLLFACRVFASKTKILYLHGEFVKTVPGGPMDPGVSDPVPLPFSLNGSTLTDLSTGKVFANLPSVPSEPFFGPMETLTSISPGGWIQMGIAFPPLPPPPMKDGKKQPYLLMFSIPALKIETQLKLDPETLKPIG